MMMLVVFATTTSFAKKIAINKCCTMDQHMTRSDNYTCVNEKKDYWTVAKIYVQRDRKYLQTGDYPRIWEIKEGGIPKCDSNNSLRLLKYTQGSFLIFGNSSLFIAEYNKLIPARKYCVDYDTALVCQEEIAVFRPQVKKCCGNGALYSDAKKGCAYSRNGKDSMLYLSSEYETTNGFPDCKNDMVIAGDFNESSLQPDGSLQIAETNLAAGDFCLEHVLENAGTPRIFVCRVEVPFVVQKHPTQGDLRFTLYPIGLALSAVFLAATLVAGSLLPASHHVLHWRCQTNHVACLLLGDVLLCIVQLSADTMSYTPCFIIAVSMHFLFLSAFFWLNTMCFNIWWTFRDLRPQSLEKSQERWRLRLYELYAWGFPLLIAGVAALLDSVDNGDYLIQPGFTKHACWFAGNKEILTYFFGPIGCLLAINLILFAATARELTCGLWKRELVKSTTERAALGRVCMKLVVVMGVTWIADVISWAVGGPQEIWYLTDLINCLQGVFIFIVVGLQPQVLTAVKRVWCLRKNRTAETAGNTNHHSSSLPSMGDTNNSITNGTTKTFPETSC